MVNEKELYQKNIQAQVSLWKAELEKFKAMAVADRADLTHRIEKEIKDLEAKIAEGEEKLKQLTETSDDAWESIKDSVKSTWESWKLPGIFN